MILGFVVSSIRKRDMEMDPAGQRVTDSGTAGVIARPPLLFLAALLLGFVLDRLLRLPFPVPGIGPVHRIVGGALILIGLALAAAGIRNFSRAGTPVRTITPTRALVTTGIHGWTRNPIYLGMFLLYGGIGVAVQNPWILILTLPLAITIRFGVVAREEAYLERRFGDAYRDYKARVRRWL
jgi:protein-S-isoprenylcysteine O-methyltransferase Ste14